MNRTLDVFRERLWFLSCAVAMSVFAFVAHLKGTFEYQVGPDSPIASYPTFMLFWLVVLTFALYGVVTLIRLIFQTAVRSHLAKLGVR